MNGRGCVRIVPTESEDWTVEEDGEPAGEPVASTTSARATSMCVCVCVVCCADAEECKEMLLDEFREEKEARTTAADDLKITSI